MKHAPKRIYLQVGDNSGDDFRELSHEDITWSDEKIFESDICYIREVKNEATMRRKNLQGENNMGTRSDKGEA